MIAKHAVIRANLNEEALFTTEERLDHRPRCGANPPCCQVSASTSQSALKDHGEPMTLAAFILTALTVLATVGDAYTTSVVRQIGIDTGHTWKEGNIAARFLFRILRFRPYLLKPLIFAFLGVPAAPAGPDIYAVTMALWIATGRPRNTSSSAASRRRRR